MLAFKCCYIGFLESEFTRFRLEGSVASYQLALPTWTSKLHPYPVWLGCTDIDEQTNATILLPKAQAQSSQMVFI